MSRMTEERWKVIQERREFVGVTLHDEMIAARKADLKCIAELEAQIDGRKLPAQWQPYVDKLEAQINACNYFLKQAGLGVDIPAHLIKLEAQMEAVKSLPDKWDGTNISGYGCRLELLKALEVSDAPYPSGSRDTVGGMLKDMDTGEVTEPTTRYRDEFDR